MQFIPLATRVRRLAVLLVVVVPTFATAAQLGIVTDLKGRAVLHHPGAGNRPLDILEDVAAGDEIELGAGTTLVVTYLATGDEFLATGPARLSVAADRMRATSGTAPQRRPSPMAALSQRVVATGGVIQAAVRMRGNDGVALLAPAGSLLRAPSRFQWQDSTDAAAGREYGLELLDDRSGRTLLSQRVTGREFTLPPDAPLQPGGSYAWRLEYQDSTGRRRVLEMPFKLAGPLVAAQWERERPGADAALSDWVVYAAALQEAGFNADASRIWAGLAAQRPGSEGLKALARP